MAYYMKAEPVDSILDAQRAGHRGAFKFWKKDTAPDGQVDGLTFICPGCGEVGGLNFAPGGWTWDGNRESPTCSPSILHDKAVCGWHGFLTDGEFRSVQ